MAKARRLRPNRPFIVLVALSLGLFAIVWRLTMIQTVEAHRYQKLAEDQRLRDITLPPRRGAIFDRQGEELAVSLAAATVFANQREIKNIQLTAATLSPVLNIPEADLAAKLSDPGNCCFLYLARQIHKNKGEEIKKLGLPGVGVVEESCRQYPYGTLAAHVIGFAGTDGEGLTGLELQYDSLLHGKDGKLVAEVGPAGRPIPGGTSRRVAPVNGQSITLTLDKEIQYKAEDELRNILRKYGAKGGIIVVQDARTGEIYALANEPTFNLNFFSKAQPERFRNQAIVDVYEPGSVMKTLVAAAALEEELYTPVSTLNLPPTLRFGNNTIGESHPRPARTFTFTEVVSESSNVGIVTIGMKLGKNRLYEYLKEFGLTTKTGVDFPGEASSVVPQPRQWSQTTIANVPFGQGVAVTALQMTQVFSIIANDGRAVEPHLLKEVLGKDPLGAEKVEPKDANGRKVLSIRSAKQMKEILAEAVESGTGKQAALSDYRAAGKTGTAQKPRAGGRGYAQGKYVASFIGFAPVEDPQLVVAVIVDEPKGVFYGGLVAAPAFKSIAEFSLRHLKIPPPARKLAGSEG